MIRVKYIPVALVLLGSLLAATTRDMPGESWPRTLNTNNGTVIKIYQPEPESLSNNELKAKAVISVQTTDKTDPVFGTFWTIAQVQTDNENRRIIIQSIKVPNIKLSGQTDKKITADLKSLLESQLPQITGDLSLDEILSQLETNQEQKNLSKDLNTAAPKILYASRPSLLVLIDGTPKLQRNEDWSLDVVVNTPFTIVKNNDGKFYLYGGKHWYSAAAATGPYSAVSDVPGNLQKVEKAVNEANNTNAAYVDAAAAAQDKVISDIIVSTQPAELIQTDGPANFTAIDGTTLSYADNSGNDIFMDVNAHQYYVLISGRWYTSPSLRNHWKYVASGDLPADFAKIPEGSPKDNVLASVAGTAAAREAVMDAQVPQTAKVDRSTATTSVVYNGNPRFQSIQGTKMKYAVNTSSSVLLNNGIYYTVDNGVWFQSQDGPNGPWIVCTERPEDVDRIPASNPLYNVKYVYVYDVTPGYVYMGYTPGYLNTFIYGPTVVYGTGFYYDPWFNGFYYARPWTWGFNMCYNPWAGWSIGYGYSFGWFNFGISFGRPGYWNGGWWGPRIYRPPYAWNHHRSSGYYGRNYSRSRNVRVVNNYNTTNIYVNRTGVVTHNNRININNNRNNRIGSFNNTNNRPGGARPEFNNNNNNNSNRLGPANGASARPGFNQNRTPQVQNQPEATRPATRPAPLTPVAPQTQRVPNTAPNNNGRFSDRDVFQRNQNNTNNSQQPQRQPNTMRPAPTPNNNNNNPAPPARNFSIERGERKH